MKRLATLAIAAAAALPAAGLAQDTALLVGTWECRVPAPPRPRPADRLVRRRLRRRQDRPDGRGRRRLRAPGVRPVERRHDADGWIQVQPPEGQALLVKPLSPPGQNAPAMSLKHGGASYHCRRLRCPSDAAASRRRSPRPDAVRSGA